MKIEIRKVSNKSELKRFVRFNYELYKDNPYSVPDLLEDQLQVLDSQKNPAFAFCEAEYFLAYRGEELVGRVACLVNHHVNQKWDVDQARFGWFDFIDDAAVSRALLEHAEEWARMRGYSQIIGPMGFTDFDPEGMLIEGFDQLSTMSSIYNYPYYQKHVEALGYVKEADWVERFIYVPRQGHEASKEKYFRVANLVQKRYKLKVRKFKNIKELRKDPNYIYRLFDVVNEAYEPLFGFCAMTRKQVDAYANQYLKFLDFRFLTIIENEEGVPIALGVAMPSLSKALQKAKGKLFPFGWWHLFKSLYWQPSDIVELLIIGVLPQYQKLGVNAMIFADIIPIATDLGFRCAESNPQLETNLATQNHWDYLDHKVHKRRRCYVKHL